MSDKAKKPLSSSNLPEDDLMDPVEEPEEPEIDWLGDDEDDDEDDL